MLDGGANGTPELRGTYGIACIDDGLMDYYNNPPFSSPPQPHMKLQKQLAGKFSPRAPTDTLPIRQGIMVETNKGIKCFFNINGTCGAAEKNVAN